MINKRVTILCITSDFEKDNVFLTNRAQDYHKMQYQRSM
jgi:hypothetical protein